LKVMQAEFPIRQVSYLLNDLTYKISKLEEIEGKVVQHITM